MNYGYITFEGRLEGLTIKKEEKMKIEKRYREPNAKWHKESLEDCIRCTEGMGHWKRGTVKAMLKKGITVFTPFAEYRRKTTS